MELYRYDECSEYSQNLCAGIVSFGLISLYTKTENAEQLGDARFDKEEGLIKTFDGITTSDKLFSSPTRVFCCSTIYDKGLEQEFGQFVVRITDADRFAFLLAEELKNESYKMVNLMHQSINYTDNIDIADYQFIRSQCFTKPERFSHQHEYRYAFVEKDELGSVNAEKVALKNAQRRAVQLPKSELKGLFERIK